MSAEISPNNVSSTINGSNDPQPSQLPPTGYPVAALPGREQKKKKKERERKKWFEDMRGWIMVVAVLVASVTYTAGLNPPGGFWQDNRDNHKAGSAILRDQLPRRYRTFFYANATAFMASLVIIILLMNKKFYCNRSNVVLLNIIMVLDLVAMMIAFAAGTARSVETSTFLIVFAVVVLLFVVASAFFLPHISSSTQKRAPKAVSLVNRCVGSSISRCSESYRSDGAEPVPNSPHSAVPIGSWT